MNRGTDLLQQVQIQNLCVKIDRKIIYCRGWWNRMQWAASIQERCGMRNSGNQKDFVCHTHWIEQTQTGSTAVLDSPSITLNTNISALGKCSGCSRGHFENPHAASYANLLCIHIIDILLLHGLIKINQKRKFTITTFDIQQIKHTNQETVKCWGDLLQRQLSSTDHG